MMSEPRADQSDEEERLELQRDSLTREDLQSQHIELASLRREKLGLRQHLRVSDDSFS